MDGAVGGFIRRARLENSRAYILGIATIALSFSSLFPAKALREHEENSCLKRDCIFGFLLLLVQRKAGIGTTRHVRNGHGGRLRDGGPFLPIHRFAKVFDRPRGVSLRG